MIGNKNNQQSHKIFITNFNKEYFIKIKIYKSTLFCS